MAEESPLSPSDNSALSHKRRITDVVSSLEHHVDGTSLNPTITVSPLMEVDFTETQDTQISPEQSPKKAKLLCSQNLSLTDKGSKITESLQVSEKLMNLDGNGEPLQDGFCAMEKEEESEIEQLGDIKLLNFDGEDDVSKLILEIKNVGFEQKEVVDKFLETEDANSCGIGDTCKDCLENESGADCMIAERESEKRVGNSDECSLTIEVFDGTAVVDVSAVDVSVAEVSIMEGKKNRRKGKKGKPRNTASNAGASNLGTGKCVYSRKEMEAQRFVNVKCQKKFWQEVYDSFSATVRKEYDELVHVRQPHKIGLSTPVYHQPGEKKNCNDEILGACSTVPYYNNYQGILGESCSGNVNSDAEIITSSDYNCNGDYGGKNGDDLAEEWSEEEESIGEYESIQRPAFKVEGEPDFESGPPEDGLEYLRRVRWEAKQIPKVKVAKLKNVKLNDQSVYMPKIPDIEQCPPHLVPLRQWEEEFIADFSELRLALLQLEDTSNDLPTDDSDLVLFARHECKNHASKNMASLKLTSGPPILSAVLAMDPVCRVTMLRRRISLFESSDELLKDDCVWLFALCAVVETPLDADTCASLRCLLRRCASLRAGKAEVDDEVIMLNVLATISGRYFGQSEL